MNGWYFNPQSGSTKIPIVMHDQITRRIMCKFEELSLKIKPIVRFSGQFCYIDAQEDIYDSPTYLVRMRFFTEEKWSLAFYTYSNEKYTPCVFPDGSCFGTIENAVKIAITAL